MKDNPMKFFIKAILISIISMLQITIVNAADLIGSAPGNVYFGYRPASNTPISKLLEIEVTSTSYVGVRVRKIEWKNSPGSNPFSFSGLSVGDYFQTGDTVPIDISGVFNTAGHKSDTLLIDVQVVEGEPQGETDVIEVPITANIDCIANDPKCNPKGPVCTVGFNSEYHTFVKAPSYKSQVRQSISNTVREHYSGFNPYKLPLSFLWDIVGIGDFFDPLNTCCNCSGSCAKNACATGCVEPLEFKRVAGSDTLAQFSWPKSPAGGLTIKSKSGLPVEIEVKIPDDISGTSIIGGSYIELHFANEKSAPSMKVTQLIDTPSYPSGSIIYDGPVLCTGTTLDYATIKHPNPSDKIPTVHVYTSDSEVK